MRGERLAALSKELEEMTNDGRSDADMAALRRSKNELELKVKDQVCSRLSSAPSSLVNEVCLPGGGIG